ncbi:hypothetical protein BKA93DRAFT_707929, partial [Sparassis latifolia]
FQSPKSPLAIRIWSGSMEQYGQYCLDFYHVDKRIPVNTPDGYEISPVSHPGVYAFGGKLVSWETAMRVGRRSLRPGAWKYSAPEGSRLVLTRAGGSMWTRSAPSR